MIQICSTSIGSVQDAGSCVALLHESTKSYVRASLADCMTVFKRVTTSYVYTRCALRVLLVHCRAGFAIVSDADSSVASLDDRPNVWIRGLFTLKWFAGVWRG